MNIKILRECGYEEAMLGLSLSYNTKLSRMPKVSDALAHRDGGHNKFLESMCVWLDITAPRYWWCEFDTYRVGVTKQSESTMHTLLKGELCQDNFEVIIPQNIIDTLNDAIAKKDLLLAKAILPESFLQRRIVATNYKTLRNIFIQRRNHKLIEWTLFCVELLQQLEHPDFIKEGE